MSRSAAIVPMIMGKAILTDRTDGGIVSSFCRIASNIRVTACPATELIRGTIGCLSLGHQ
ncbi:hypothetical protein PMI07_006372 [Rhizobium sp. CF080]|nr:hypothetical protein PMI07_006372 [Rhizobium sp. CF080]